MRALGTVIAALALAANHGQAQPTNPAPADIESDEEKLWAVSLSAYAYLLPDARDYVQPTISADIGWLHFESRYNYENLDTSSTWLGYNFSGGEKLAWEFTPMVGAVLGASTGIAPGYKGSLSWWKLELYSEGEYFFDSAGSEESYLYNWSELTLAPVDWFRFGLVTQRLRTYGGDRDIQRGVLAGFTYKNVDLAGYVINPDSSKPTLAMSVALSF